jgi:hypothetical protein
MWKAKIHERLKAYNLEASKIGGGSISTSKKMILTVPFEVLPVKSGNVG